jgi:hypothetical protein
MSRRGRRRNARNKNKEQQKQQSMTGEELGFQRGTKEKLTKAQKKAIKKAKKKENKMARTIGFNTSKKSWFGGKYVTRGSKYAAGGYKAITKPSDGTDDKTLNIVLFKQSFLNNLANQCVPIAGGAEFQVHYRALQIVIAKEGIGRIVYTIPTVFFNFNQTVTSGSVDYDLVEVDKISKELQPESMEIANQIAALFPKSFFEGNGFSVSFKEDEVGSIHRHPGDFSFSSIDLDNNPKHPGVIYRRGNASDLIQTDSVMYITGSAGSQHVKLVTTQTRVVNVNLLGTGGEDGIEGSYNRAKTVALILKDTDTAETIQKKISIDFNAFFNEDEVKEIETPGMDTVKEDFLPRYDKIKEDEIQEVLENTSKIFKLIAVKIPAPTSKVDEKLIKPRGYGNYAGGYGYQGNTRVYGAGRTYDHITGTWIDEEDDVQMPKKFNVLDFLAHKGLHTKETKVTDILDDAVVKEMFWMCAGKDEKVSFKLNDKLVIIEPVSKASQLLKVIYAGATSYKAKSIFENNDISDELKEAGYIDAEEPEVEEDEINLLDYDDFDPTGDLATEQPTIDDSVVDEKAAVVGKTDSGHSDVKELENSQDLLKITRLFEKHNLQIPDRLLKDIGKDTHCEQIFKKAYPGVLYDNNGLLKVYGGDGFSEILMMLPVDTGILFYPKTDTDSFVYIAPIDEGDTHGSVTFCNNAVEFNKQVPLYQD